MSYVGCNQAEHFPVGRRELLKVGSMSLLGTGLSDVLRMEAEAVESPGRSFGTAKSVVFINPAAPLSMRRSIQSLKLPSSIVANLVLLRAG